MYLSSLLKQAGGSSLRQVPHFPPLPYQLLKVPTHWLKGRREANSICFLWHRGLRNFGTQTIQSKKQCKNRLGNFCAVTFNEAIENISHSPASEACCERRIRSIYVPSTRKPQALVPSSQKNTESQGGKQSAAESQRQSLKIAAFSFVSFFFFLSAWI